MGKILASIGTGLAVGSWWYFVSVPMTPLQRGIGGFFAGSLIFLLFSHGMEDW